MGVVGVVGVGVGVGVVVGCTGQSQSAVRRPLQRETASRGAVRVRPGEARVRAQPRVRVRARPGMTEKQMQRLWDRSVKLARRGRVADAVALVLRVRRYVARTEGKKAMLFGQVQGHLGALYRRLGDFPRAEPCFRSELRITAKKKGRSHLWTAYALNRLAGLYKVMGRLGAAEKLYRRSLTIREARRGKQSTAVGLVLNNLAGVLMDKGDYAGAHTLYLRALTIHRNLRSKGLRGLGVTLGNLGVLYKKKGDFKRAERSYLRALAIGRKHFPGRRVSRGYDLNNLAALYMARHQLTQALPYYKKAVALWSKHLSPTHPLVATALDNLGILYHRQGKSQLAEDHHKRALAIRKNRLGPDHPHVGIVLNNLASVLMGRKDYAGAERLLQRALTLYRKGLNREHPLVAISLQNLAILRGAQRKLGSAWELHRQSFGLRMDRAENLLPLLSERAREDLLQTMRLDFHGLLRNAVRAQRMKPLAAAQALAQVVRYQGVLLSSATRQRELAALSEDATLTTLLNRRNATLRQRNRLIMGGRGGLDLKRYQTLLSTSDATLDRVSEKLARATAGQLGHQSAPTPKSLGKALGKRDALVVFTRYRRFNDRQLRWTGERYAAFVLRPKGRVALVDLGSARTLDRAIVKLRSGIRRSLGLAHRRSNAFAQQYVKRLSRTVYALAFAPLEPHLTGTRRLFITPEGKLGLVPLEILAAKDGRSLGMRLELVLLDAARDLLALTRKRAAKRRPRGQAVALVAPAYGGSRGRRGRAAFRSLAWKPAWSQRLAGLLGRITGKGKGTRLLVGAQATEANLRRVRRPLLLHLYTHGFYLPDHAIKRQSLQTPSLAGTLVTAQPNLLADPMRRSGVALAGANGGLGDARAAAKKTGGKGAVALLDAGDDGILTAEEASTLDLTRTELVVLGACETGVGETRQGQGVYGLRRALLYAGARSLLVSLWKVPEQQTRELLWAFYAALAKGSSRGAALRSAQATVRKTNPLAYYWAGFVLIGDPGKIR
jgi:tetratricopeptide (TPR) repeat protein